MNPIFFRNYTKCFIAISGRDMYSYFFNKIKGKWLFDKSHILINYDYPTLYLNKFVKL